MIIVRIGGYDDRLCGLVVRVPSYRSKGPGSNPGTTRFSENQAIKRRQRVRDLGQIIVLSIWFGDSEITKIRFRIHNGYGTVVRQT
jgi:hypothetical protein